jgi:hypothetical protein
MRAASDSIALESGVVKEPAEFQLADSNPRGIAFTASSALRNRDSSQCG